MSILLDVIFILFLFWVVPSSILYNAKKYQYNSIKEGRVLRERTITNYNFWALLFNIKDGHFTGDIEGFFKRDWKPKSGIDKEIAEEEKEIAELERQKEKIDTLANLKRRKERLFSDVHGKESWECKWCGSDDCLKPAYTVDGIAQYYCTSCHRWLNDGSSMV
ncbi:hypothetical protein SAMN05216187_108111 [Jeotgalicoccus aerolatus]|uniref:Uncharacterized protein n=1 Tax=Jeotgalicoccus aerolatus TaxID=709510 RepID=A0A1G9BU19_9STAP|nr:hypothetical protein [Jeotgalicoccus aerolatus]SDK42926.1 hypothetical protein SAMN05216187_108111 [Jeotgalicoccus aerolatus]